MAKWHGKIGFLVSNETNVGVSKETIINHEYSGDLLTAYSRTENSDSINDNINISNRISIIADPFANQNFLSIKYVEFMGTKWKVTGVEVQCPRLILTIGGVYNGYVE